MIPADSVLARAGQSWKFWLMVLGLVLSVGAPVIVPAVMQYPSPKLFLLTTVGAVALGVASFTFGCLAIRCPSCKVRWLWSAVRTQGMSQWFVWLVSQRQCPSCGTAAYEDAP